ncbi:amidase signature domain-containing protein [Aspergillus pseudoustus]|uniref:Amidase signature domain-containing protein n=1 Tax=Aspergillus pseudoustus TaxID=1810923 RepID=A0ABR4JM88_9EURO
MINRAIFLGILISFVAARNFEFACCSMRLQDVHYFISPLSAGRVCDPQSSDIKPVRNGLGLAPVTVVAESESDQPAFLDTIFVGGVKISEPTTETYYTSHTSFVIGLSGIQVPSGPYFVDTFTGEAYPVFRLYDDFAGAFSQSLLQTPDGHFQPLSAQGPSSGSITIGVPSRLYFTQTKEKPLVGVRSGVKDIFPLAGMKRSNGNRAWYGLYPPANSTSIAIQNLIDAGAIIVGLQKPSQFANGETPTADWVNYHAPFNPRGDGYQDTASSSAGAGSSIGSYEWLDLAVVSDTGGSIRGPAGVQGVFGNRPTHGLVSLDGVMPTLDTVGFLTRDPYIWDIANAAFYGGNFTSYRHQPPSYPRRLHGLDFPTANSSKGRILSGFAANLADFLGARVKPLDLDKEWARSAPAQAKGQSIAQLLNTTYITLISKDQTRLLRDRFYEDYAGNRPRWSTPLCQSPPPLARWSWGDGQPESAYDEAIANKTLFMNWFNEKILPPSPNPQTCSSSIILHTDSTGYLYSRNRYLNPPALPFTFSNGLISVFAETPDSVYPLGEIPVFSAITNHTELVPVTVDIIAARGCDSIIAQLAKDLVAAGVLAIPRTGKSLQGGEILR